MCVYVSVSLSVYVSGPVSVPASLSLFVSVYVVSLPVCLRLCESVIALGLETQLNTEYNHVLEIDVSFTSCVLILCMFESRFLNVNAVCIVMYMNAFAHTLNFDDSDRRIYHLLRQLYLSVWLFVIVETFLLA